MVISLGNGSVLTLQIGTGRVTTIQAGERRTVVLVDQLRALLTPLGRDAAEVHLREMLAWCAIALDRDGRRGVKATRHNRANWERSRALLDAALELGEQRRAA
jgi:hypothetical protein